MFMIWIHYVMSPSKNTSENATFKKPCFFVYPFRNYKTTIVKAPMAHRTYSQEQFMIRYYKLSISFKTNVNTAFAESHTKSVNEALYFCLRTKMMLPCIGTNMLFLHKYSFNFYAKDTLFFSFFTFNNNMIVNSTRVAYMMKLVDMQGLKPCPLRGPGSTPGVGTKLNFLD